jgi:hypothetical protein
MNENKILLSVKERFLFSFTKTKFSIITQDGRTYKCVYATNGEFEITLDDNVVLISRRFYENRQRKLIVYLADDNKELCVIYPSNWFVGSFVYDGERYGIPNIFTPQIENLGIRFSRRGLCGLYRIGLVKYLAEICKKEHYMLGLALTVYNQGEIALSE